MFFKKIEERPKLTSAEALCSVIREWKKVNLADREVRFYRDEYFWTASQIKLTDIQSVSSVGNFIRIETCGYTELLIDAEQIFAMKLVPCNI